MMQVKVLRPVVVTQYFETASWYRKIELVPGTYVMRDASYGITKELVADIPGKVVESSFPSSFCGNQFGDGNRNTDVGQPHKWTERFNLEPNGFWDRALTRYDGAVVLEVTC